MKKPQTPIEKPATTTKAEPAVAVKTTKPAPKKTATTQAADKKAKAAPSPIKEEQPIAPVTVEATAKKSNPKPAAAKKKETPVTAELTMAERVGLTAGSIWHYLSENGATPVAKLVTALTEEEKIIQRSIGWLAQEDKITLDTIDRIETVALKA